jgi:hypothetical protein
MKTLLLIVAIVIYSFSANCQVNTNGLIQHLNKLNRDDRVWATSEKTAVFLNKADKTLEIGEVKIDLTYYTATADSAYNSIHKKMYPTVRISCSDNNGCITRKNIEKPSFVGDKITMRGVTYFFKTKAACFDYINTIYDVRSSLLL